VYETSQYPRHARTIDPRQEVHPGAYHVEGANDRELQSVMLPIGPDEPLQKLLGASVRPPLHVHRTEEEARSALAHPGHPLPIALDSDTTIDLAGREVNEPFVLLGAHLHHRHQIRVAGGDHFQRTRVVEGRIAQSGEGKHDVAFGHEALEQAFFAQVAKLEARRR